MKTDLIEFYKYMNQNQPKTEDEDTSMSFDSGLKVKSLIGANVEIISLIDNISVMLNSYVQINSKFFQVLNKLTKNAIINLLKDLQEPQSNLLFQQIQDMLLNFQQRDYSSILSLLQQNTSILREFDILSFNILHLSVQQFNKNVKSKDGTIINLAQDIQNQMDEFEFKVFNECNQNYQAKNVDADNFLFWYQNINFDYKMDLMRYEYREKQKENKKDQTTKSFFVGFKEVWCSVKQYIIKCNNENLYQRKGPIQVMGGAKTGKTTTAQLLVPYFLQQFVYNIIHTNYTDYTIKPCQTKYFDCSQTKIGYKSISLRLIGFIKLLAISLTTDVEKQNAINQLVTQDSVMFELTQLLKTSTSFNIIAIDEYQVLFLMWLIIN
ncbi:Hypothetical_protein [Hexamita inflata]|uniref:Hypothetical_protein n=1 Tax=Hexamita inflata TaxID=28002 RepID=A0ABP1IZN2_9EUKA